VERVVQLDVLISGFAAWSRTWCSKGSLSGGLRLGW